MEGPIRHRHNSGLEEELYVLRRYLFTLAHNELLNYPLVITATESPDFRIESEGLEFGIEVTVATSSADQREMTLYESREGAKLLGLDGGRYHGGAVGDRPERDLTSDAIRALRRKARKAPNYDERINYLDVLMYASSNASVVANSSKALALIETKLRTYFEFITNQTKVSRCAVIHRDKLFVFYRDCTTSTLSIVQ